MNAFLAGLGLVCGLWVAGCGGGGPAGSCRLPANVSGAESCVDFTKGYSASSAKEACNRSSTATYSDAECTATNRVGRCTDSDPDGLFTQVLNYYGPTTLDQAMMSCASASGTFAAN